MQIWIATNNRDVPREMKTKFPATVMVFGVVSSKGHIMPPHIFEVGLKVNTKVYLNVLKSAVIPWSNQVAGERPWVWQQDSAPAHKSIETQAWLQKECYDLVQFDPLIKLYQVLPLRTREDIGVMAMTEYSAFPKAPALLELQHQFV